jgi:hypothetical protein
MVKPGEKTLAEVEETPDTASVMARFSSYLCLTHPGFCKKSVDPCNHWIKMTDHP